MCYAYQESTLYILLPHNQHHSLFGVYIVTVSYTLIPAPLYCYLLGTEISEITVNNSGMPRW